MCLNFCFPSQAAGFQLTLLVPVDDPNTPKFLERKTGPVILGFEFKTFMAITPPTKDFDVPRECTGGRLNRLPLYKLKPSL